MCKAKGGQDESRSIEKVQAARGRGGGGGSGKSPPVPPAKLGKDIV